MSDSNELHEKTMREYKTKEYKTHYNLHMPAFVKASEFDEVNDVIVDCISAWHTLINRSYKLSILELGCGGGFLTRKLATKLGCQSLTVIDFSEDMISKTKWSINAGIRISYINCDLLHYETDPSVFSIIVSSFTLHHLSQEDRILLFKKCFKWLRPEGILVNGDIFLEQDQVAQRFMEHLRDRKLAEVLDDANLKAREEHRKFDRPCTIAKQMSDLYDCKFRHVMEIFKRVNKAVLFGTKHDF